MAERRSTPNRRRVTRGGRRNGDPRSEPIIAPPGSGLEDRMARVERSVEATRDDVDLLFVNARNSRADISRVKAAVQNLTDALQALTGRLRKR